MVTTPAAVVTQSPPTPRFGGVDDSHRQRQRHKQPLHRQSSRTEMRNRAVTPPVTTSQNMTPQTRRQRKSHVAALPLTNTPPRSPRGYSASPQHHNTTKRSARQAALHQTIAADLHDDRTVCDKTVPTQQTLPPHYMLPTPASLPRKKQVSQSAVNAAARVLFPTDTEPKSSDNSAKKKVVEFAHTEGHPPKGIEIFTDSKERLPDLDVREDNPFLDPAARHSPTPGLRRSGRRKPVSPDVKTNPHIKTAFDREDGMVYVFRGKKVYRRFVEDSSSDSSSDDDDLLRTNLNSNIPDSDRTLARTLDKQRQRPLTRTSIKPRLLFPAKPQHTLHTTTSFTDEEAPTEIDEADDSSTVDDKSDPMPVDDDTVSPATPVKSKKFPTRPGSEPTTPPSTVYQTRAAARRTQASPAEQLISGPVHARTTQSQRLSPFDGWARTKASSAQSRSRTQAKMAMSEIIGMDVDEDAAMANTTSKTRKRNISPGQLHGSTKRARCLGNAEEGE